MAEEPAATALTITEIHVVRGVALVTGTLTSGQVALGDELHHHGEARIGVLGIEFHAPKGSVTIVVSLDAAPSLRVGESLTSGEST